MKKTFIKKFCTFSLALVLLSVPYVASAARLAYTSYYNGGYYSYSAGVSSSGGTDWSHNYLFGETFNDSYSVFGKVGVQGQQNGGTVFYTQDRYHAKGSGYSGIKYSDFTHSAQPINSTYWHKSYLRR